VFRYNTDNFNTIHVNLLTHVEEVADPIHESEQEDNMSDDEKTEEERKKLGKNEETAGEPDLNVQDPSSSSSSSANQSESQKEDKETGVQAELESGSVHVAQGGNQTHEPAKPEEGPPKTPPA
jgi:hypothetical protein